MIHLHFTVRRFVNDDTAATMIEYALMLSLIAVVCVAAVRIVGTSTNVLMSDSAAKIAAVAP